MKQAAEPRRPRRRAPSPWRLSRPVAVVTLFLVIGLACLFRVFLVTALLEPLSPNKAAPPVLVRIPPGSNVRQIGALLARKGVIRTPLGFVLAARLGHLSTKMKPGFYDLSPAWPPRQIAYWIALGKTVPDGLVTIPEGYTLAQIGHRLAEKHLADETQFDRLARTQGRTFVVDGFRPPDDNLEGYLFPDTYRIRPKTGERQIIEMMLRNFQHRVMAPEAGAIAHYPGGLKPLVTLASLVEREAETDADRPQIAAALNNRLRIGMRLDCDATIEYALPAYKTRLFNSDLRVDSPYNTYRHAGLPPTPIANPGLASLEAALHPADVGYLYYVARPDGSHIFSTTLAEHDRAIAQVRAMRRRI